jgi:hypothetical protein
MEYGENNESQKYYRAEVYLKEGGQDYDIMAWSEVRIIHDILTSMRNIFILSILFSRNNIVFFRMRP